MKGAEVRRNIQRQSNYVLGVVLFATALFFAGTSTRVDARRMQADHPRPGCRAVRRTVVWLATLPLSFSI